MPVMPANIDDKAQPTRKNSHCIYDRKDSSAQQPASIHPGGISQKAKYNLSALPQPNSKSGSIAYSRKAYKQRHFFPIGCSQPTDSQSQRDQTKEMSSKHSKQLLSKMTPSVSALIDTIPQDQETITNLISQLQQILAKIRSKKQCKDPSKDLTELGTVKNISARAVQQNPWLANRVTTNNRYDQQRVDSNNGTLVPKHGMIEWKSRSLPNYKQAITVQKTINSKSSRSPSKGISYSGGHLHLIDLAKQKAQNKIQRPRYSTSPNKVELETEIQLGRMADLSTISDRVSACSPSFLGESCLNIKRQLSSRENVHSPNQQRVQKRQTTNNHHRLLKIVATSAAPSEDVTNRHKVKSVQRLNKVFPLDFFD